MALYSVIVILNRTFSCVYSEYMCVYFSDKNKFLVYYTPSSTVGQHSQETVELDSIPLSASSRGVFAPLQSDLYNLACGTFNTGDV